MTKLTQQEISNERLNFKKFIEDYYFFDIDNAKDEIKKQIAFMWHAFIVRAELDKAGKK